MSCINTNSSLLLSLSKLGLKAQDLPARLLSRLQSLERWDLSGNRLQELPKNLELPALHYLDLSDNQIEDVTTLESLSGLEELKMEDNLYITVSTRNNRCIHTHFVFPHLNTDKGNIAERDNKTVGLKCT